MSRDMTAAARLLEAGQAVGGLDRPTVLELSRQSSSPRLDFTAWRCCAETGDELRNRSRSTYFSWEVLFFY